LVPGRRVELTGREAFAMQQGLGAWLRTDAKAAGGARAVDLDVHVEVRGPKLEVTVTGEGRTASIGAVLRAWQAGVDVVPLEGGGWGKVPLAWLDKHGDRLADLLASRAGDHRVPPYALPD